MLAYTKGKIFLLLKIDFIRFCIVGGLGFLINFVILASLHTLFHLNVFLSQLIAAEVALFSNFTLHHYWTYKRNRITKTRKTLLLQFHVLSWPAILGSALLVSVGVSVLRLNDLTALVFSSAIALGWNFVWSKYVIWRDVPQNDVPKLVEKG